MFVSILKYFFRAKLSNSHSFQLFSKIRVTNHLTCGAHAFAEPSTAPRTYRNKQVTTYTSNATVRVFEQRTSLLRAGNDVRRCSAHIM